MEKKQSEKPKSKDPQSKYWCFTCFEMDKLPQDLLKTKYEYLVYQTERCKDTQRLHFQCYVVFKTRTKFSTLKNISNTCHWEMRQKSHTAAKAYCMKSDTRVAGPWEYGEDSSVPETKGERTDLKRLCDAITVHQNIDVLAEDYGPEIMKYTNGVRTLISIARNKTAKRKLANEFALFKANKWQAMALVKLERQNDRKILWIVDEIGNSGKTYLGKYLQSMWGAAYFEGAAKSDVAHAYKFERIVVFDYTRSNREYVNYSILESFKNGQLFSSKYDSMTKTFSSCKVICFSNWEPDCEKLSKDRWEIMDLGKIKEPMKSLPIWSCPQIYEMEEETQFPMDVATETQELLDTEPDLNPGRVDPISKPVQVDERNAWEKPGFNVEIEEEEIEPPPQVITSNKKIKIIVDDSDDETDKVDPKNVILVNPCIDRLELEHRKTDDVDPKDLSPVLVTPLAPVPPNPNIWMEVDTREEDREAYQRQMEHGSPEIEDRSPDMNDYIEESSS